MSTAFLAILCGLIFYVIGNTARQHLWLFSLLAFVTVLSLIPPEYGFRWTWEMLIGGAP